eukprot:TRINITY_DN3656_c0_g1_i1.p1 TRINITY_DN3656_c0_g1~~TRINITY_DN3656_c0_g1_i1.p1  ORF type:complete len:167 (+),score=44.28 TRINITY_DN3656_c0_g1_i1:65-565(+)
MKAMNLLLALMLVALMINVVEGQTLPTCSAFSSFYAHVSSNSSSLQVAYAVLFDVESGTVYGSEKQSAQTTAVYARGSQVKVPAVRVFAEVSNTLDGSNYLCIARYVSGTSSWDTGFCSLLSPSSLTSDFYPTDLTCQTGSQVSCGFGVGQGLRFETVSGGSIAHA